jgi:hypothetical protein
MSHIYRQFRRCFLGLQGNSRSIVTCAMILSFLLAHFGYPVWEPAVSKGNVPFPCQFSRCSCQSAGHCGQNCCCSKGAKVAKATFKTVRNVETKRSCCRTKPVEPKSEPGELRWVLAISASECHGTGVEWIQAGFVAAPPRSVSLVIAIPEAAAVSYQSGPYSAPLSERLFRPV